MQTKIYTFHIENKKLLSDAFMTRFHFEKKDYNMITALGQFLSEYVEVKAGVLQMEEKAICIVTLGSGIDEFEELLERQDKIFMSYCAECISMEMLSKAYEMVSSFVGEETGNYLSDYQFMDLQAAKKEECVELGKQIGISLEEEMIKPLKSVIYEAFYSKEKPNSCIDCSKCDNINCSFRDTKAKMQERDIQKRIIEQSWYSYGAKRIFGGNNK